MPGTFSSERRMAFWVGLAAEMEEQSTIEQMRCITWAFEEWKCTKRLT